MTEQRVPYDLRQNSRDMLADWYARRFDTVLFNQICGNTAENRLIYTGHNAVRAPSPNRHLWAGPNANADEDLTAGDTFNLNMIDAMRIRAENSVY